MRGIAATWVLLFHASGGGHIDQLKAALPKGWSQIFELGDNGVAIFFVLSGFVIAHSLRGREITPDFLGRFALRRSIRLDPPMWVSIAFVLAVTATSAAVKGEPWAAPTAGQLLTNATYTQIFAGYTSINPVYWTLCYEVQFYLALCLGLMAARYARELAYITMFLIALVFGAFKVPPPFPGLFVELWHCFFLGVLAYWAHQSRLALVGLAALCLALIVSGPNIFTVFCVITSLVLYVARQTGFIQNGLTWRPLMFLGTISYSLYLTHNPVTGAAFFVLYKIGMPQWAALIGNLLICFAAGYLFWLLIERPSMNFAHTIRTQRPSQPEARVYPETAVLAPVIERPSNDSV